MRSLPNKVSISHNPQGLELLTRLRLGLSHLRHHNLSNIIFWIPLTHSVAVALISKQPLRELFWSAFSRIRTFCPYSVRMQESADQNNSEYGQFLRSELFIFFSTTQTLWKVETPF